MVRLGEQMPIEAGVVIPFAPLTELAAHEEQLLARACPHIGVERAQVGELAPAVARHFVEQRALAVHDLIMRERQDEILAPRVHQPEGEIAMMKAAENRIEAEVAERVVHPAHVTFEAEAETAYINRTADSRPRGRLFGDRRRAGMLPVRLLVHLLQK